MQFVRPKAVLERHTRQQWPVGARVRVTKAQEPALRDVPPERLTATGIIAKVILRFPRTPILRSAAYTVELDSELLGEFAVTVIPGSDSLYVELI